MVLAVTVVTGWVVLVVMVGQGRRVQRARMNTQPARQVVAVVGALTGVGAGGVGGAGGLGAGNAAGSSGRCQWCEGVGVGMQRVLVVQVVPGYVGGRWRVGGGWWR